MTIKDFGETVWHSIPEEVYNDLLQVLREADADLQGVYDHWDFNMAITEEGAMAALETKTHLEKVYKDLTGQDIGTHVPLT